MAAIPEIVSPTVRAIYAAYEAANEHYDSLGISVGEIGEECDRALYYTLHWASQPEEISGRTLSIFETGNQWEERLVSDLEMIGVDVYGQQDRIRLVGGHIRGKCDGKGIGLPEAPKTEHLFEFKSSNAKGFALIKRHKCKKAKPLHYGQCQIGMHAFGLTRCGYYVVNKDDDERHFERIEYDAEYCLRQLARVERLIHTNDPPARISEDPKFFGCLFCKHKAVCHDRAFPRVSCRTCIHATPELGGDAHWSCARWSKPLSVSEQKSACPNHLFDPAFVPGKQTEFNEQDEWIEYEMFDGSKWRDGGYEIAAD